MVIHNNVCLSCGQYVLDNFIHICHNKDLPGTLTPNYNWTEILKTDLTQIDKPLGDLDSDTRGRLFNAWFEGEILQVSSNGGVWEDNGKKEVLAWVSSVFYRVKPADVPDSINWDHVNYDFVVLRRKKGDVARLWRSNTYDILAETYSSYKKGNMEECVVYRPGHKPREEETCGL